MKRVDPKLRVLAIDPTHKGFGFAVLEGPDRLIDWGVKQTEAKNNAQNRVVSFAEDLLQHYEPDAIVTEDCDAKGSRLGRQAQDLTRNVAGLAAERKIRTVSVSRLSVKQTFNVPNKHELAKVIADRFPELKPRVFPYRRTWMSEDHRTPIFDAMGFAVTFYQRQ